MPQSRTILIPLSQIGFDASEASVPWTYLSDAGVRVIFATKNGHPAQVDPLINEPKNFPILFRKSLATNWDGMRAFKRMIVSTEFQHPLQNIRNSTQFSPTPSLPQRGHGRAERGLGSGCCEFLAG